MKMFNAYTTTLYRDNNGREAIALHVDTGLAQMIADTMLFNARRLLIDTIDCPGESKQVGRARELLNAYHDITGLIEEAEREAGDNG